MYVETLNVTLVVNQSAVQHVLNFTICLFIRVGLDTLERFHKVPVNCVGKKRKMVTVLY